MKDKLLFWINVDMVHFGIAKFLQEKYECKSFAIIDMQNTAKDFFLEQKLVNFEKVWYYRDHVQKTTNKTDMKYLSYFEKKYNINIWEIVYSEILFFDHIRYYKFKDDEILPIIEQECKLFEKILDEIKPDYFLVNAYSGHHTHLLCKLCKAKGIKILMYTPTRIGYRVAITSHFDILDIFDMSVKSSFSEVTRTNTELQNYLNKYNIIRHNREDAARFDNRISKHQEIKDILRFLIFICNNNYRKFYGNYGKTRLRIIKRQASLLLKKWKRSSYLNKHCIRVLGESGPFVYFPLHIEPERVLSFGAPFYSNQLELITLIAKSLPIGYKLYVKEHPMMYTTEGRDISFYKKILNLPNVYLVHTLVQPEEVMKNCSLVVTINGTAGLEAAFYGKPSIAFGETGYSFLPSMNKVKNLEELPHVIRSALEKKVDLSELNQFVDYMNRNSFEFDSRELEFAVASRFFHGGFLGNVEIPQSKMKSFLEEYGQKFEQLAMEHIKKIKQYKENKLDNAITNTNNP